MVKVALASALLCAALSSASAQRPVDLLKERIAARVEALAENPRTRVICPEQQGLRLAGCLLRDATAQAMLHTAIKRVENIEELAEELSLTSHNIDRIREIASDEEGLPQAFYSTSETVGRLAELSETIGSVVRRGDFVEVAVARARALAEVAPQVDAAVRRIRDLEPHESSEVRKTLIAMATDRLRELLRRPTEEPVLQEQAPLDSEEQEGEQVPDELAAEIADEVAAEPSSFEAMSYDAAAPEEVEEVDEAALEAALSIFARGDSGLVRSVYSFQAAPAPPAPRPNPFTMLTGAINTVTQTWMGVVNAFRSSSSKTVVNTILGNGFKSLRNSVVHRKIVELSAAGYKQLMPQVLSSMKIPRKYLDEARLTVALTKFSSQSTWVKTDIIFPDPSKSGNIAYASVIGYNHGNGVTSWVLGRMTAKFALAPDLFVWRTERSVAGGIFSKVQDKIEERPASLKIEHIQAIFSVMNGFVLETVGNAQLNMNVQLPQI